MERILSSSDSYETASICYNIVYIFSNYASSSNAYLSNADNAFDSEFICFKSFVHSNSYCYDPVLKNEPSVVQRKIDLNNPELYRFGYEKEMIAFQSLRKQLNAEEVRPCIDMMHGVPEIFEQPEQKADIVKTLYQEREDWRAEKETRIPSYQQRKIVKNLLNRELINFVEVSAHIDPETFGSIEKKMSQYIQTINSKISLHTSDSKAAITELKEEIVPGIENGAKNLSKSTIRVKLDLLLNDRYLNSFRRNSYILQ